MQIAEHVFGSVGQSLSMIKLIAILEEEVGSLRHAMRSYLRKYELDIMPRTRTMSWAQTSSIGRALSFPCCVPSYTLKCVFLSLSPLS